MKHRGIQTRISKVESRSRRRDKPFIVKLNYDEPFPENHEGTIYVRMPHPDCREPTIDNPLTIDDLIAP